MAKGRGTGTVGVMSGWAAAWMIAAASAQTPAPLYQSRFADAPPARVGQASRSAGANVQLVVLAPNRKGASARPSPRLAWFLSAPSTNALEIVVQERGADVPLLERRFKSAAGGLQSIDLDEFGVRLAEGKEYEWSVALINDPARRASDQFSKGVVQYVPSSEPLPSGAPEAVVSEYLARGYWYDAIGVMQQALLGEPPSPEMVALSQRVFAAEQLGVQP
jgi:Domain of Unknown Function (DUF928)